MSFKNLSISFCVIALCALSALGQEQLQASIKADKPRYFITEPVNIILEIRNAGSEPVKFADRTYDRSGRLDDYLPVAARAGGERVEDPLSWRQAFMGGGLSGIVKLEPGRSITRRMTLNEWCLFNAPGRYEIHVQHGDSRTNSIFIELVAEPERARAERKRMLLDKLRSPGAEARAEAARELGYLNDASVLKPLIESLCDAEGNVAVYSIFSLMRNPALREEMMKQLKAAMLRPDYPITGGAINLLTVNDVKLDDREIESLLKRKSRKAVGRSAVTLWGYSKPAASPYIKLALRDTDPDVRKNALSILTFTPDLSLKAELKKQLADSNHEVRHQAAGALLLMNDKSGLEMLLKESNASDTAASSEEINSARSAMAALGSFADDATIAALVTRADGVSAEVKATLIKSFAIPAGGSVKDELYRVLDQYKDVNKAYVAYIREAVFTILPEIDPDPYLELIRSELKSDHENHRAAVVGTLSGYRIASVMEVLVDALDDQSPVVQSAALDVLGKVADETLIPRIELLLETSDDYNVRMAALRALSAITVGAFDWMKASGYSFYVGADEQRLIEKALPVWREWREANLVGFSSLRARKELVARNTPDLQQGASSDLLIPAVRALVESGDESAVQVAKAFLKTCEYTFALEAIRILILARDPLGIELAIKLFERGDSGSGTYAERLLARATGVSFGRLVFGASGEKVQEIGRKWREWWEANRDGFKFDR